MVDVHVANLPVLSTVTVTVRSEFEYTVVVPYVGLVPVLRSFQV